MIVPLCWTSVAVSFNDVLKRPPFAPGPEPATGTTAFRVSVRNAASGFNVIWIDSVQPSVSGPTDNTFYDKSPVTMYFTGTGALVRR